MLDMTTMRCYTAVVIKMITTNKILTEMQKKYPEYSGENYLDMTAGFFFA